MLDGLISKYNEGKPVEEQVASGLQALVLDAKCEVIGLSNSTAPLTKAEALYTVDLDVSAPFRSKTKREKGG